MLSPIRASGDRMLLSVRCRLHSRLRCTRWQLQIFRRMRQSFAQSGPALFRCSPPPYATCGVTSPAPCAAHTIAFRLRPLCWCCCLQLTLYYPCAQSLAASRVFSYKGINIFHPSTLSLRRRGIHRSGRPYHRGNHDRARLQSPFRHISEWLVSKYPLSAYPYGW